MNKARALQGVIRCGLISAAHLIRESLPTFKAEALQCLLCCLRKVCLLDQIELLDDAVDVVSNRHLIVYAVVNRIVDMFSLCDDDAPSQSDRCDC